MTREERLEQARQQIAYWEEQMRQAERQVWLWTGAAQALEAMAKDETKEDES